MTRILIVVPCYNEEKRLSLDEFGKFTEQNKNISFVFVNDASTDKTRDLIMEICAKAPLQMRSVHLKKNLGKAGAVRQGFLFGFKAEEFAYMGYWDADLSTPLEEINNFLALFNDPDVHIVMGARVQLLGRKIERVAIRHYFGRLFATLASIILKLNVYDTQCGAKIFRRNEGLVAAFGLPFQVKWTFDVEILARYLLAQRITGIGLPVQNTIIEHPLMEWRDVPGSNVRIKDAFVAMYELFRIYSFLNFPGGASARFKKLLERK